MKYIDAEKLKAEIINRMMSVNLEELGNFGCHRVWAYNDVKDLITSLQQEQPDYKEAVQLVFEEKLIPFKDGNQWCFLLGRDIQEGVCGFGDTILDAAIDFYKDYSTTRIHIGELKKTMEQPEVDLEKEIKIAKNADRYLVLNKGRLIEEIARYFYELGLNTRNKE